MLVYVSVEKRDATKVRVRKYGEKDKQIKSHRKETIGAITSQRLSERD